ncbi:MAG: prepilin-type N-terminal cleavage/methylation domain-containing protein [Oscillospiraceae bacterium]|nr:prepilin-type N-terminal cleavage/methylation domain-containing protein [Oscillospiraceae bacterium]
MKNLSKLRKRKKGFTLVEILVVIVIIGLLFAIFVPRIDFASNSARETGVKSDFRSFELAAEQLVRENAGLGKHETVGKLCAANGGLNLYLDDALKFTTAGVSAQNDPWNKPYTVQLVGAAVNQNNGGIIFLSGGKDGAIDGNNDFAMATVCINGVISSETSGFSSNIESNAITSITADSAAGAMTVSGTTATLKYKK